MEKDLLDMELFGLNRWVETLTKNAAALKNEASRKKAKAIIEKVSDAVIQADKEIKKLPKNEAAFDLKELLRGL